MCFLPSLKSASSLAFWSVSCTTYCVFSTAAFSTLVYDIFTPILCGVVQVQNDLCFSCYTCIQTYKFGLSYALVTIGTLSVYAAFTLGVTQWR